MSIGEKKRISLGMGRGSEQAQRYAECSNPGGAFIFSRNAFWKSLTTYNLTYAPFVSFCLTQRLSPLFQGKQNTFSHLFHDLALLKLMHYLNGLGLFPSHRITLHLTILDMGHCAMKFMYGVFPQKLPYLFVNVLRPAQRLNLPCIIAVVLCPDNTGMNPFYSYFDCALNHRSNIYFIKIRE